MIKYVIFSFAETKVEDEHIPMFWNNTDGWGILENATLFTQREMMVSNLPLKGMWVRLP